MIAWSRTGCWITINTCCSVSDMDSSKNIEYIVHGLGFQTLWMLFLSRPEFVWVHCEWSESVNEIEPSSQWNCLVFG